jgi:hypothetical protein
MISRAAALGLVTLMVGLAGTVTARADDGFYGDHHPIARKIADVRRDEARLQQLQRRRGFEAREGDWGHVRALDHQISDLRGHIAHDRREIHRDFDRDHRDADRDRDADRF